MKKILQGQYPGIKVTIKIIKTTGDKVLDVALSKIGDKGLFTEELEAELAKGGIDIAVHSLKDLPSELDERLTIGAVLKRENPQDVLLSPSGYKFDELPQGAVLGTSSLRRRAQVKALRNDIEVVDIRGNVETRVRKMQEQGMDGIILAYAGVKRLGLEDYISDYLALEKIMPAVGQGIIAIESRRNDEELSPVLAAINDSNTLLAAQAERSFLYHIQGGCQAPVAALAHLNDEELAISGIIAALDGQTILKETRRGLPLEAEKLGQELALMLLAAGGTYILNDIKNMEMDESGR